MVELKIGRRVFDITEKDVVLFNGACWQLITQKIPYRWSSYSPKVSKTLADKLVKKNILVLVKKSSEYVTLDGKQMGLYYYKFDMNKLNEFLGDRKEQP